MTYQCIRQPPCPASGKSYFIIIVVKESYMSSWYDIPFFIRSISRPSCCICSERVHAIKFHKTVTNPRKVPHSYQNRHPLIFDRLPFPRRECEASLSLAHRDFLTFLLFSRLPLSLFLLKFSTRVVNSTGRYTNVFITGSCNDDPIDHWSSIVLFSVTIVFGMFITL